MFVREIRAIRGCFFSAGIVSKTSGITGRKQVKYVVRNGEGMVPDQVVHNVRQAFERCQARYPTVDLPFEAFAARVDEVLGGSDAPESGSWAWLSLFGRMRHEDLFLALACARGNRVAWEYLVDEYLPILRLSARRACGGGQEADDLAQEILTELLGESSARSQELAHPDTAGSPPAGKLAGFSGRGSLAGWLRVIVAHAAIDRARKRRKQISLDQMLEVGVDPTAEPDAQLAHRSSEQLDSRWSTVISGLLRDEIEGLPAKDRLMLSLYYVQEVPLKAIGRHFGVHEATASRWLERLRRDMRRRIERECRKKHGLGREEVRHLWQWAAQHGDFSLRAALGAGGEGTNGRPKKVQDRVD